MHYRSWTPLTVVFALLLGAPTALACTGDCDGDGTVAITELVLGVDILTGGTPVSACTMFDADESGDVEINELIEGVGNALNGCPGAGQVAGQVVDVNTKQPLAGVAVSTSNGRSTSTDDNGFYSFEALPAGSLVLAFARSGYATNHKQVQVTEGPPVPLCVLMKEAGTPQTVNAASGGTFTEGDSRLQLAGGSLRTQGGQPVAGEVDLVVTKADPSTADVMSFPGSFETAMDTGGQMVQLESFGFATYELTQNGQKVDLAPGQTATIEFILPDNAQDQFDLGETIPLWEFDDTSAMWMQSPRSGTVRPASDGSGRKAWVAEVDHFSSWNCDAPITDKNCVSGRVVEGGAGVAGALVTAVGLTYNGTSSSLTGADGTFCVDVKRGSRVRLEVTVNGAATPLATREVAVPDSEASCAQGGCLQLGDISIAFDSCVRGRVTDNSGNPVANETVYVVPGETVQTNANGEYCARAPGNVDVYVFAIGRPSVKVRTRATGSCATGNCVEANLPLSLPHDGDTVGFISASRSTLIFNNFLPSPPLITSESFDVGGSFFAFDPTQGGNISLPGFSLQTETIGNCDVTTSRFEFTFDPEGEEPDFGLPFGFSALDPGNPGSVSNASRTVELQRGDPFSTDPPTPSLAGVFSPPEGVDLLAQGFDAGQTMSFSWPGGADIGAFSGSVRIPPVIQLITPAGVTTDPSFQINVNAPFGATWAPAQTSSNEFIISVSTSTFSFTMSPDGTFTSRSDSVTVRCTFPDSAGSGTIPQSVMSRLQPDSQSSSVTFSRLEQAEVRAPLRRTGGSGVVVLSGSADLTRSVFGGFPGF
jgi:hypothetical protein